MSDNLFETEKFRNFVKSIVESCEKFEEPSRKDELVISFIYIIENNPGTDYTSRELFRAIAIEAHNRAAKELGYQNIDFPKEIGRLISEIIRKVKIVS